MSQENSHTNAISDRESKSQPNCEDCQDIGHTLLTQQRPKRWRRRRLPPSRVPNGLCSSSPLTSPSRQDEQATGGQDQPWQSCTDDGPGASAAELKTNVTFGLLAVCPVLNDSPLSAGERSLPTSDIQVTNTRCAITPASRVTVSPPSKVRQGESAVQR